ncbi:hypothetical protein KTI96_18835 [Acinetobacter bereziniae]|nr:hypothetical protein [Acinetobacter bereziniae]MCU4539201.1 hypothetical protein [Acinetobacter bereziniae]
MFSTPKVWDKWQSYYKELGYETIAPAWPLHDIAIEQQRSGETQKALG